MTLCSVCLALISVGSVASAQTLARLTRVQVLDAPHATAIHLHIDGDPRAITNQVQGDPAQLVLRLEGTVNATDETDLRPGSPRAARVEIQSALDNVVQIVVTPGRALDPFRNYGVTPTDRGVLLTVGAGELVLSPEAPETTRPPEQAEAPPEPAPEPAPEPPLEAPVTPPPPLPDEPTEAAEAPEAPLEEPTEAAEAPVEEVEPPGEFRERAAPTTVDLRPTRADGLVYRVSDVQLQYARMAPGQPHLTELQEVEADLLRTPSGYLAPRQGIEETSVRVVRPAGTPAAPFYGSAIRAMNQAIVDAFNEQGLIGVLVRPHPEDIDPESSRDLRADGNTTLRLVVWTGRLIESRTFASGERIPEAERTDNPAHRRIKENSPIEPGEVLNKNELDGYVSRLNRHPGRTVDVTLTKSLQPGGVYLDYLVAENKPWSLYAQVSNTGTDETSDWRQRLGLVHNQLTGRDDILRLDYVTGDFDEVHAGFGSYETPIPLGALEQRLRFRVNGNWSKFDASEVGIQNAEFEGEQWTAGGQLIGNVIQYRDLFVDLFAGGRYQHVDNDGNPAPSIPGTEQTGTAKFFLPEVGLRAERRTEESTILLGASFEANAPQIAGTNVSDLNDFQMGRAAIDDKTFEIYRYQGVLSFFLEPLFPADEDPSTPASSTLAHEIFLQSRGQFTSSRLIPYHQAVAGGLNTVRGYEQSLVASDEAVFWRGEYRLHVPRLLPIQPTPASVPVIGDFRVAPQQVFGRPDWDLILRGFVDGARVSNNDPVVGELDDETLLSVGGGLELQLLSNFVGRIDYGYALEEVLDDDRGHDEIHLSFTVVY